MLSVPPITVKLVDSDGRMSTVWHSFFTALQNISDTTNGIIISSIVNTVNLSKSNTQELEKSNADLLNFGGNIDLSKLIDIADLPKLFDGSINSPKFSDDFDLLKLFGSTDSLLRFSNSIDLLKLFSSTDNINTDNCDADLINLFNNDVSNKTLTVVYDDNQIQLGDIIGQSWFGAQWSDIVEYRTGVAIRLSDSTVNHFKFKFNSQLPHTYAEGNDILFHLHIGNNSTTTGDVVLKFTWEWANVDEAYGASVSETKTFTVTGTNGLHEVFEFSVPLSGTGKKISSILLCEVERLAADSADTFAEDLYVTAVDFHIPVNTNGSRQEWIK